MKYVKILGLLAVAASALMAFAGTASATTITSPTGTTAPSGTTFHAESEENAVPGTKHVRLHNNIAKIDCTSTATFTFDDTSGTGTATGKIDNLTFTCTHPWVVHVEKLGALEVHWTNGYNGTLTASAGTTVTATHTTTGAKCTYQSVDNLHIGTITGGDPATLHVNASIPRHGGSLLCGGANASWTGAYVTTGPVFVDSF